MARPNPTNAGITESTEESLILTLLDLANHLTRNGERLAREEGIFSEPAGTVALAGALQAFAAGEIDHDAVVVCPVTGSGFKDAASVKKMVGVEGAPLVELAEFEAALGES